MTKKFLQIRKRSLSIVTAGAVAASLITVPAVPSYAGVQDKPYVTKAGSISVSEDNVTENQPFTSYTAGSKGFRIPALISLENGDLLGTADARWERYADGGGLDMIASVSSDGGKTWNYSFPMFFPDSNGFSGHDTAAPYWSNATTIIDSCILEGPDGTVYCFADVNPTGATTLYQNKDVGNPPVNFIGNNPDLPCNGSVGTGTGYITVNGKRHLALTDVYKNVLTEPTDDDLETYPYYVGDFTNGYAPILNRADSTPTGYGVDEWYNLYSINDAGEYVDDLKQMQVESPEVNFDPVHEIQQNVYYEGSKFHIYCIAHIWMVTSNDHGRTWTNLQDINDQVKRHTNEHAILVSPGKGIVTSDGTILFGVYDNNVTAESQHASIVYSTDRGKTWKRSNDVPDMWSSENEIVEIKDGKGTLRMFFRNGNGTMCYADAIKNDNGEYQFESAKNTKMSIGADCNLSALSYSKKINGKLAIMVACPSTGRSNGKIYTFLVNDDPEHTMELVNEFSLGSGGYSYSCMTEQADGSLALLWEKGNQGGIFFNAYDVHSVVPGAVIEDIPVEVEIGEGEEYIISDSGDVIVEPDDSCATVSVGEKTFFNLYNHNGTGTDSSLDSFLSTPNNALKLSDAEFTFTAFGDNWQIKNEKANLYLVNTHSTTYFNANAANMKVTQVSGKDRFYITQNDGKGYVLFYAKGMNFDRMDNLTEGNEFRYEISLLKKQETVSEDDIIPGYKLVSQAAELESGSKYLIAYIWDDNNIMILYPVNGKFNQTKRLDLSNTVTAAMTTITGKSEGYTTAVINGIVYRIHVIKDHPQPDETCSHITVEKNRLAAACETEGYTGDQICTICNGIVEKGSVIPALGHNWDKGSLQKAVTKTENGEMIYHCANDVSHKKIETIYTSAYAEFMKEYNSASDRKENEGLYTSESFKALKDTLADCGQAAKGMVSRSELYEKADVLNDANAALVKKSAAVLKQELQNTVNTAEKETQRPEGASEEIWTEFTTARANAKEALSKEKTADEYWQLQKSLTAALQKLDMAKEVEKAKDKLMNSSNYSGETLDKMQTILESIAEILTDPNATTEDISKANTTLNNVIKVDEARTQLKNEIEAAEKQLASSAGYTMASVNSLKAAISQAQTALNKLDSADKDTYLSGLDESLNEISGALSAIKGQKLVKESNDLKDNDFFEENGMRYQLVKASALTAKLVKGTDTAKLTIDTVKYNGKTYMIVEIGDNAFNGCKQKLKKVTIGANVEVIGKNAFKGCKKLANVKINNNSKLKKVNGGAFKKTSSKIKVKLPKNLKKNKNIKKQLKKAGIKKGL